ncbi:MAG: DUF3795 domain-containing protein [archaeon]|nr:DUF3795 domain-containing protein [archaeon]
MGKIKIEVNDNHELFAPCGMYCGFCGSYLAKKNEVPRRRGIITYCAGCRPRNKQCAWLTKRCSYLLNNEVSFCIECPDYPCSNLEKINDSYMSKFSYKHNFKQTLEKLQKEPPLKIISAINKAHQCDRCGDTLCIHNNLCYNCDKKILAEMKNYRNDK